MLSPTESDFQPDWVSPPGETIEILEEKGLTVSTFAETLNLSEEQARALLKGTWEVSISLAGRLSNTLGGSTTFWLNREAQYREDLARTTRTIRLQDWLAALPIKDMIRFGWMSSDSSASGMGSTPFPRTVLKELKTSDPAWQPVGASEDCGIARCSQTHPPWRHRGSGIAYGLSALA